MAEVGRDYSTKDERIVLGLLESVERDGAQSQRKLASELGIALGLVNAYLKRCVKKGLLKVSEAPARRYAYYLTPQGFAEKSKLTVDYLSYSFLFFRQARADCTQILRLAKERGVRRIALAGASDLAEIVRLCALESDIEIVAIVDPRAPAPEIIGIAVTATFDATSAQIDAVVVTDMYNSRETYSAAVEKFGASKVYAPTLLGLGTRGELP
jgi:DNA-binding MarR family transcriptional regulator